MSINLEKQAQIKAKAQVRALIFDKAPTIVLVKYFNYNNIFSAKYIIELLKYIRINDHTIKLEKNKQLFFKPIYSLEPVKLEILKIYIKINIIKKFIQLSKFFANISILFDKKQDRSLYLCINYQNLNNLIIKNLYLFPLIRKTVN